MRKIKTKKESKTKKMNLVNFKNQILKQNCYIDMNNKIGEGLGKAYILIGLSAVYLKQHRRAWEVGDAYLKPYLKGLITKTANSFEKFANEKLKEDFIEKNLEILNKNVVDGIIGGTSQIKEKVKYKRDIDIFEPFVLGSICIGAVKEKLKWIGTYDPEMADGIKEIFKTYDKYLEFWEKEIDPFNVSFQ